MKIFLKCPACHNETTVTLENKLTSRRLLSSLDNQHFCAVCQSRGLGNIHLDVIKFDWEKNLETERNEATEHVPTHLDKTKLTPDQINANMERERQLTEKENKKQ